MGKAEDLYFQTLRSPEDVERDSSLEAYLMTKGALEHNDLLVQGIEPTDAAGNPLYATYKTEEQIIGKVTGAYGKDDKIQAAMKAAHTQHYKEKLIGKEE